MPRSNSRLVVRIHPETKEEKTYPSAMAAGRDTSVFPSGQQAIHKYAMGHGGKYDGNLYKGYYWRFDSRLVPTGKVKTITIGPVELQVSSCGLVRTRMGRTWRLLRIVICNPNKALIVIDS